MTRRIHRFISAISSVDGASRGTARWLFGFCHTMGQISFHSSHCSLVRGACPGTAARSGVIAYRSTRSLTGAGHAPSGATSEHSHSSTRSDASSPSRFCTRLTCISALSGALADTSLSTALHCFLSIDATHTSTSSSTGAGVPGTNAGSGSLRFGIPSVRPCPSHPFGSSDPDRGTNLRRRSVWGSSG